MDKKLKVWLLQSIVAESGCDFGDFCDNVMDVEGSAEKFKKKFSACKNRKDIENLVNKYI